MLSYENPNLSHFSKTEVTHHSHSRKCHSQNSAPRMLLFHTVKFLQRLILVDNNRCPHAIYWDGTRGIFFGKNV